MPTRSLDVIDVIDHVVHSWSVPSRLTMKLMKLMPMTPPVWPARGSLVGRAARIARMERAAVAVRDDHRPGGRSAGIEDGPVAAVRNVHDHADAVHPLDDARAELGEAGIGRLEGAAADQVLEVVGQLRLTLAESVEHVHIVRRSKMLRVLKADQDAELALAPGALEVAGPRDSRPVDRDTRR